MARYESWVKLDIAKFCLAVGRLKDDECHKWINELANCLAESDPSKSEFGAKLLGEHEAYLEKERARKRKKDESAKETAIVPPVSAEECGKYGIPRKDNTVQDNTEQNSTVQDNTDIKSNTLSIKESRESVERAVREYAIDKYEQSFIDKFCRYWFTFNAKKKAIPYDLQSHFDIPKRLATFAKRESGSGVFTPPTKQQIIEFGISINAPEGEADKFYLHYGARAWMMGQTKMGDWKFAFVIWLNFDPEEYKEKQNARPV